MVSEQGLLLHLAACMFGGAYAEIHMFAHDAREELVGCTVADPEPDVGVLLRKGLHRGWQQHAGQRRRHDQRDLASLEVASVFEAHAQGIQVPQNAIGNDQCIGGRLGRLQ